MPASLAVIVDGVPLPEPDARAFWERFSAHMEEHKGDLAGFAKAEGLSSVRPEMRGGAPTLVASRTAAQVAYRTAPSTDDARARSGSGSPSAHSPRAQRSTKPRKKPRG